MKRALFGHQRRTNHSLTIKVERAATHGITGTLRDWQRFAGQRGLIGRRFALDDQTIDGEQFSRLDEQLIVRLNLVNCYFDPRAVLTAQRPLRRGLQKRFNCLVRAMIGELLERIAEREKKEQGCAFGPGAHERCAQRDKYHQELNVDSAALQAAPDILGREPAAGDVGNREEDGNETTV